MSIRIYLLSFLLLLSLADASSQNQRRVPNIAVGVNRTTADSLLMSHFNIGLLGNVDALHGVQTSLFTSVARKEMRGVQLSGISNVGRSVNGVQLSGFSNVSSTPMRGIQIGGITNISMGVKRGIQFAGVANISSSYMRGLQFAAYNYADTLNGSQIGIINVCQSHPRGIQVGIINYSRDTTCHKIGLVNVNPKTTVDFMAYGGTTTKGNLALRFRNRSTYNIIGVGTHYMGLDEKFSGALFYRIGQYFRLTPRLSISGDLGFYHIETFERNTANKPERLYSLQARLNLDYQFNPTLGAFVTAGYGDTRYYYHSHRYRHRALVEAGITLRYNRAKSAVPVTYDNEVPLIFQPSSPLLPKQSPNYLLAAVETFGINAGVWAFDRYVLNADFARISGKTISHNFRNGFVWDNDQFSTNLFAHPYHGGLYFNAARTNGLNFWQSVPYSFGGSLMWEIVCEKEPPAMNDFIATSVGGVSIGEVTHRLSALVLDDSKRGWPRFWREFLGTLICPVRGLNRLVSGEAWRISRNARPYHDHSQLPVDFSIAAGYRYLADNNSLFRGEVNPYLNLSLVYGQPFCDRTNKPYDYFTADISFGLSSNQPLINRVNLLGRLWGTPLSTDSELNTEFGIYQHFNYFDSHPVSDGSSLVPYRISEAASFGPGVIFKFPEVGCLTNLEQRIFLSAILLGGSQSDYYNVIDRDYNLGSGYSAKTNTLVGLGRFGTFSFDADYYRIFTWKGYEDKDLTTTNPLYLNAQGDKSNAQLLVLSPKINVVLSDRFAVDFSASYFLRHTNYRYHDNVTSKTFEVRLGGRVRF